MRPRDGSALALLAFGIAWSGTARAVECAPNPLSSCIDSDTLWPTVGKARFLGLGGAEPIRSRHVAFGLVTTVLSRPVVLTVATPGGAGTPSRVIDDQANGTFLWGYGITERLSLDVALPVTFYQSGAGLSPVTGGGELAAAAVRDLRFGATYTLVHSPDGRTAPGGAYDSSEPQWSLTGRLVVAAPTGDESNFAGDRTAVFAPSFAGLATVDRFFFGAEVGARIRGTSELAGARFGPQLVAGAGAGVDILSRHLLAFTAEARVMPVLVGQGIAEQTVSGLTSRDGGTVLVPAEWAVGLRSAPLADGDLSFHLGGGGPIPFAEDAAVTAPRFRFTLAIRYAPSTPRREPPARDVEMPGESHEPRAPRAPAEVPLGEPSARPASTPEKSTPPGGATPANPPPSNAAPDVPPTPVEAPVPEVAPQSTWTPAARDALFLAWRYG